MASTVRAWMRASRLHAQANVALPLAYGQALAWSELGTFDAWLAVWIHAFGLADQLFIVWANDAADAESDALNATPTPFSGGSRVIPLGLLRPRDLLVGAALAAAVLLGIAGYLQLAHGRVVMLPLAMLAIALLWAYSFAPLRLSYRGHGELLQAAGVGVVLPMVGFHAQGGPIGATPWLALVPSAALGWAGNVLTALPDAPSDAATSKRTYPVRRGQLRARRAALAVAAAAIVATPMAAPGASEGAVLAVAGAAGACLALAGAVGRRAVPGTRACTTFVALGGGAISVAFGGWTLALVVG